MVIGKVYSLGVPDAVAPMEDVRVSLRVDRHTGNLSQSDAVQVRPLFDLANLCNTQCEVRKGDHMRVICTWNENSKQQSGD